MFAVEATISRDEMRTCVETRAVGEFPASGKIKLVINLL